jgi:hypothetical protein
MGRSFDMQERRTIAGETFYICSKDEPKPALGIWFTTEEWEWAQRLGKNRSDPQEQKEFFEGILERKRENSSVSVFDLFPREGSGSTSDPALQREPSAHTNESKQEIGRRICGEIQDMLRGRGARTRQERETG